MSLVTILAAEDPAKTHHWLLPEAAELIYGTIASVIIIGALVKFAGPAVKKAMAGRTERIQEELDASAAARADADSEAERIRQAKGDIEAERARILAEADEQAEALLTDGRARLADEIRELEARGEADIAAAASRSGDELRGEIARHASAAAELALADTLDEATQQELIEQFIARVGASAGATT